MLPIRIPENELFNERTNEFIKIKAQTLCLEHSLISISKWESKWHKPFLGKEEKTWEESVDYIRCMTITQNVDENAYYGISDSLMKTISDYVENPMTATTVRNVNNKKDNSIITAEIIYYWMIELGIPFECEKWHLNRLMMLIRVCSEKQGPQKKMSQKDIWKQNHALNASRRAKLHSKG